MKHLDTLNKENLKNQYTFKKQYEKSILEGRWDDREFIKVLMKDVSTLLFKATKKEPKIIDMQNLPKFPVFEGKPNSGKSTMLIDVVIPIVSSILIKENICSIFILINPASDILKNQTSQLAEEMTNREPISYISFNGKSFILEKKRRIVQSRRYFDKSNGVLLTMNQPMINAGKIAQNCKGWTKDLTSTIIDKLKKDKPDYKLAIFPMMDECRISSPITNLNAKMSTKNPFQNIQGNTISYMPALIDYFNFIIPKIDYFQVIGFDGTPKYNQKQMVPKKKVAVLPGLAKQQTDDYDVLIHYGGDDDIWEVQELSEFVPKEADTLDESFYAGMTHDKLQNWNRLIDESLEYVDDLNKFNLKQSKEYNTILKKYGVQISDQKRMIICMSGADDEEPHRFVKGEEVVNYLQMKKTEHALYTDDKVYIMEKDGYIHDNLTVDEVGEKIDALIGNGIQFCILKRKRGTGWNHIAICGVVGLSEHTDLLKNVPTAKPFESPAQSTTRAVRQYTGLVDLDGCSLTLRDAVKLISKLRKDNQKKLSNKMLELVHRNNQFKVWYVEGESDVHGQLDNYLGVNYSDPDTFLKIFKEEIEVNEDLHSPECTCGNCPIHGTLNQKIDKDLPKISKKIEDKLAA